MKLFVFAAVVAVCAAAPSRSYEAPAERAVTRPTARLLEESKEHISQDSYRFRFLSDDSIERQEQMADGAVVGSYSYVSPEGVEVSVRYVADTLGFRAEGDALPTPVPTEYPTPEVPVTEPETEARAESSDSGSDQEERAEQGVNYERVIVGYRPRYQ